MERFRHLDFDAVRAANRKQALVPEGAHVIYPAGTAPGVVVPGKPTVVVLPGPPRELQRDVADGGGDASRSGRRSAGARSTGSRRCGCSGIPESGIAETLRDAEARHRRLRPSSRSPPACAAPRSRWSRAASPPAAPAYEQLRRGADRERHGREIFSTTARASTTRSPSCWPGRGSRSPSRARAACWRRGSPSGPGSSEYVAGGVVAYSNEAKAELLGVDPALIEEHGAVSERWPRRWPRGRWRRFEADTAVAITGIAGPGGGTEEKPVGYVCWSVKPPTGRGLTRDAAPAGRPRRDPRPLDHGRRCTCCGACCAGEELRRI